MHERLGAGASGVVFAAFDNQLRRRVALKLLCAAYKHNALREARAMASVSHPNVLPIYDAGTTGETTFLTMELVEGTTLREWARAPRSAPEVLRVMIDAGRGLAAAHAAGVLHRDFKPANVLVDGKGAAKVADFGLASCAPRAPHGARGLTGARLGTGPY